MTYDAFDVVVVPFPFTDRTATKRRPVLVLSQKSIFGAIIEHSVLAMITSAANAPWPLDVPIRDGASARTYGGICRAHETVYSGQSTHPKEKWGLVGSGPKLGDNGTTQAPSDLSLGIGGSTTTATKNVRCITVLCLVYRVARKLRKANTASDNSRRLPPWGLAW